MTTKILKIAFLAVFVITSSILGTYYYYSNYLTRLQSTPPKTNDETGFETLPLNRILTTKPERQIQALFIKVDGGTLFYKDRANIGISQTLEMENSVLYICRTPTTTEYIAIDSSSPGYLSYVGPEEFNRFLKENEPILIATFKSGGVDEIVSYVAAAKCE